LNNDCLGDKPICHLWIYFNLLKWFEENLKTSSAGWDSSMKSGVYILPKLNIYGTPIVNKYFEGKLKNTLVRGWNRVWNFKDFKTNRGTFMVNRLSNHKVVLYEVCLNSSVGQTTWTFRKLLNSANDYWFGS